MATRQAYGAGSMSERAPGVWRLRVMVGGKQVQKTFRGTEAAARRELRKLDVQPAAPAASVRTFGDLLDKWFAFQESQGRSPKTLDEAAREIRTRIRPTLGSVPIADLTAEHLDDAYGRWQREGLSKSSVRRHAAVVSAALSQGVKWRWLKANDNPALLASPPASPKDADKRKRAITADELGLLIRAAEAHDGLFDGRTMAAAIALGFVTGARRGELCALRWSDVDLKAGVVTVQRSLCEIGRDLTEKSTKTEHIKRILLDELSLGVLRIHQEWQRKLSAKADSPLVDDPYVLSDNANGARPITPSKITDRFTRLRKAAGVPSKSFHGLRHGSSAAQTDAGVPVTNVAARLGHASTVTTLNYYGHALPAGDLAAAKVLGALLPAPAPLDPE